MKKNNEKKQKRERKEKGERMKEEEEEEEEREGMDQKGKWNYKSEEKRGFCFFSL